MIGDRGVRLWHQPSRDNRGDAGSSDLRSWRESHLLLAGKKIEPGVVHDSGGTARTDVDHDMRSSSAFMLREQVSAKTRLEPPFLTCRHEIPSAESGAVRLR